MNQIVQFNAYNIPSNTHYTWFLGQDTIIGNDLDSVKIGYLNSGTYSVKLKLKYSNNDTCTLIKNKYINVTGIPVQPTINASKTILCDLNESFELSSSSVAEKYTWNIGQILYKDTSSKISHKFIRTGFFKVSLTITDKSGCQNSQSIDSFVLVERKPKVELLNGDTFGCDTLSIVVKTNYNLFGQTKFIYDWDFSGAFPSGSPRKNPGKVFFSKKGQFPFKLDMESVGGCKYHYDLDTVHIGNSYPINVIKTKTAPCNKQIFGFEVDDSTSFTNSLNWKFLGDSVTQNANGFKASAEYIKSGKYPYIITHSDNECVSIYTDSNVVEIQTLKADFELDHYCNCKAPDTIKLKDISIAKGFGQVSYKWIVYKGVSEFYAKKSGAITSVELKENSNYTIALHIADTSGCADSSKVFNAYKIESLNPKINADVKSVCVGGKVKLSIDSICDWNFGKTEWKLIGPNNNIVSTSTDSAPTFTLPTLGKYSVELIYNTSNGCVDTVTTNSIVEAVNLKSLNFTLSDTTVCEGTVVTGFLKVEPSDVSASINWTFQHSNKNKIKIDAKKVIGATDEYLLKTVNAGEYDMKLIVDGGAGCKDSINLQKFLKVSGINVSITADETVGCLPFKTRLRSLVNRNEHYENASNTVKYNWSVISSNTSSLQSPTASSTNISLNKTGKYSILLTAENSDGCQASALEDDLFSFNFNADFSVDSIWCQNVKIQPTNNSLPSFKFNWFSKNGNVKFHTNNRSVHPIISFTNAGIQELGLIVETNSGCTDTTFKEIDVRPFKLDFLPENPTPKCTPAQYIFNIDKTNVDTFIWSFGDGNSIITNQTSIANVYDLGKVRPFRNWFNVRLIGKNEIGCIDTVTKNKLIHVLGPNATFAIKQNEGCNPLKVEFIDSTEQVQKFYFNYGDGSQLDSLSFDNHTYYINDTNKTTRVFKPYIIASDKNKCFVSYQPDDSIVVYANPIPRFSTQNIVGCAPYAVSFKNASKHSVNYLWDFENDGKYDDSSASPVFNYPSGSYTVKLVSKNKLGCRDSLIKTTYIKVTQPPNALFGVSDTLICPGVSVSFENKSFGRHQIVKYRWLFNYASNLDSSIAENPVHAYSSSGKKSIELIVTDDKGCTDTASKDTIINVVNRLDITDPAIHFITVENQDNMFIEWNDLEQKGFNELQVIKNGNTTNPVSVITDYKTNSISISEPDISNNTISYSLILIDRCNDPFRNSLAHSNIFLTVTRNQKPYARLAWTPYKGWDSVTQYVIYKAGSTGGYREFVRVKGNVTKYVDYLVCDDTYKYLIATVHPTDNFISYSNEVEFNPYYGIPKDTVQLKLVTTTKDSLVFLNWQKDENLNVSEYYIDRYNPLSGWKRGLYSTEDTFFVDEDVRTELFSYSYKIWYRDFCDNPNPRSNIGTSIHLRGEITNDDFVYKWNKYGEWEKGVKAYILERSNDLNNPFEEAAVMDSSTQVLIDKKKAYKSDSSFYIRVKAIENSPVPDTSYSNVIEVQPEPAIFFPNAFTPNNDGLNDVFEMKGIGISKDYYDKFTLRIYSEWGTKVFETHEMSDFWDGTFKGTQSLEGVYFYYVQLRGVNRMIYSYSGNLTLYR